MQGSLEAPPIVLRQSRTRGAWLFGGSAVFAALIGVSAVGQFSLSLGFSTAFFALCALVGLWQLVSPARLEIGPAGLTQKVLWRTWRGAWSDVYDFRPTTVGLMRRTVGFDFLKPNPRRDRLRKFNSAMTGVHGVLQSGWEIDPAALATLLNQARERWLGDEPGPPAAAGAAPAPSGFSGLAGNRMDRKTYLVASAVLLVLSVGLGFLPGGARGVGGAFTFFFIRLYAVRLHDLGRSCWWQVALYVTQMTVLVGLLMIHVLSADFVVGAVFLIQLAFTGALGFFPGDVGENRFGPAPGQPSAVRQAEVFR